MEIEIEQKVFRVYLNSEDKNLYIDVNGDNFYVDDGELAIYEQLVDKKGDEVKIASFASWAGIVEVTHLANWKK